MPGRIHKPNCTVAWNTTRADSGLVSRCHYNYEQSFQVLIIFKRFNYKVINRFGESCRKGLVINYRICHLSQFILPPLFGGVFTPFFPRRRPGQCRSINVWTFGRGFSAAKINSLYFTVYKHTGECSSVFFHAVSQVFVELRPHADSSQLYKPKPCMTRSLN